MESISVKPEKGQKSVWYIHWFLLFFPMAVCLVVLIIVNPLVFAICTVSWLLFTLPFLFWIPAYFSSLEYIIGDDAVQGKKGVFWKKFATIPYHKITNVDITQGPLQRRFHVATIHCQTAGAGGQQGAAAELKMEGMGDLDGLKKAIIERVLASASAGPLAAKGDVRETGSGDTLNRMLQELKAIRELLAPKGDR
jgi:membrane protein YdbS with pleckstrin-like domain